MGDDEKGCEARFMLAKGNTVDSPTRKDCLLSSEPCPRVLPKRYQVGVDAVGAKVFVKLRRQYTREINFYSIYFEESSLLRIPNCL